jgi:DNA-binding transcriptional MerR regulator
MSKRERAFSSSELQEAAGLTYRQINDWDDRGALPNDREGDRGWRKFSLREIFIVMVCNEIHLQFGVPVARLQFVQECMLQDDADHLSAAIQLMSVLGVGVWLMTDLEETFVMGSELEFRNLMEPGYLRAETERGYLFVNLTPLVNRLFEVSDEGETIKPHGRGYEILRELRSQESVRNAAELKVLKAIREGAFDRIEITLDNGNVRTLHKIDHPDISMSIDAFVKEHPYQSLNIAVRQGGVASLERRETERLD